MNKIEELMEKFPGGEYSMKSAGMFPQVLYTFGNGYGASVISHAFSYGGNEGLYELAVMKEDSICYSTPITDDVLGSLTLEEVIETLESVRELNTPR